MAITLDGTNGITTPSQTTNGDVIIADKIVHLDDTNTAIRFPAADTVTVETAGSERLRIDSAGNVGIGTTAPDQLATINSANTTTNSLVSYKQGGTTYGYTGLGTDNTMRISGVETASVEIRTSAQPITFNVSGTTRMTIDTSGRVTKPFQPAFIAKGLAAQTAYTANQVIVFNTAAYNVGSGYNTSNGRFTAPVAGLYHFSYQIYLNPGNTSTPVGIFKNGVMDIFYLPGVALNGIGLTALTSLAAGDFVDVRVTAGGGNVVVFNNGDHTQFRGYLVG